MKADLSGERFGVEIEVNGVARQVIAEAVAVAVGGRITARGMGPYNAWHILDGSDRIWKVISDRSLAYMNGHSGSEIVTPVLTYPDDIAILQKVIRMIRVNGAIPHRSGSVHIHVDGREHTPDSVRRLARTVFKHEELMFMAFGTLEHRKRSFAKPLEGDTMGRLNRKHILWGDLKGAWFGHRFEGEPHHYETHRYHGLNLNNLWRDIQTIEFRYANASLHAGKIKGWVQFCLAVSKKARMSKASQWEKINTDNPKYTMRVWLLSLGLIGPEFGSCRHHMLKNLAGNGAWRNGGTQRANRDPEPEDCGMVEMEPETATSRAETHRPPRRRRGQR